MKIKIYFPPEEIYLLHIDIPFLLEEDKFEVVNNLYEAHFIVFCSLNKEQLTPYLQKIADNNIKFLRIFITHSFEKNNLKNWVEFELKRIYEDPLIIERILILDINLKKNISFEKYQTYDYVFNRQKLYFTEYDKYEKINLSDGKRAWTNTSSKKMFSLNSIEKKLECKKFLAPNRNFLWYKDIKDKHLNDLPIEVKRYKLRDNIIQYAKQNTNDFWFSDWSNHDNCKILDPEESDVLKHINGIYRAIDFTGWMPIANRYYESSFISVYVETLVCNSDVELVTEKTFDPLIKGHFILPFSYKGFIQNVKNYGFILPDFIDYSYDEILDDELRFNAFLNELYRLNKLSIKWFQNEFEKNKWSLEHNRELFWNIPYDNLYEKLLPHLL